MLPMLFESLKGEPQGEKTIRMFVDWKRDQFGAHTWMISAPPRWCLARMSLTGRQQPLDFLGFTFYWNKSRKGAETIMLKKAKDQFRRSCQKVSLWRRRNRHMPGQEQHRILSKKLKDHGTRSRLGKCGKWNSWV
jgi:hypothetical protein